MVNSNPIHLAANADVNTNQSGQVGNPDASLNQFGFFNKPGASSGYPGLAGNPGTFSCQLGAGNPRYHLRVAPNQYDPVGNHGTGDNSVDSWIYMLHLHVPTYPAHQKVFNGISSEVAMACLVQQMLPQAEIPFFDGAALKWVEFIIKFKDIVSLTCKVAITSLSD